MTGFSFLRLASQLELSLRTTTFKLKSSYNHIMSKMYA